MSRFSKAYKHSPEGRDRKVWTVVVDTSEVEETDGNYGKRVNLEDAERLAELYADPHNPYHHEDFGFDPEYVPDVRIINVETHAEYDLESGRWL